MNNSSLKKLNSLGFDDAFNLAHASVDLDLLIEILFIHTHEQPWLKPFVGARPGKNQSKNEPQTFIGKIKTEIKRLNSLRARYRGAEGISVNNTIVDDLISDLHTLFEETFDALNSSTKKYIPFWLRSKRGHSRMIAAIMNWRVKIECDQLIVDIKDELRWLEEADEINSTLKRQHRLKKHLKLIEAFNPSFTESSVLQRLVRRGTAS